MQLSSVHTTLPTTVKPVKVTLINDQGDEDPSFTALEFDVEEPKNSTTKKVELTPEPAIEKDAETGKVPTVVTV
jgi:hypothetical protein